MQIVLAEDVVVVVVMRNVGLVVSRVVVWVSDTQGMSSFKNTILHLSWSTDGGCCC